MMKAVICDDDEIILKGLKSVIPWEEMGVQIVGVATDGRNGLQLIKEHHPDLLLSDIRMPYIDGLQLIEEGRKVRSDLMAVIFSGYDDFSYARRALRMGVVDYLSKPIDMGSLIQIVKACIHKYQEAESNSFHKKEQLLYHYVMCGGCNEEALMEIKDYYCVMLILEVEVSTETRSQLITFFREQGIYLINQRENRFELLILSPSKLTIQMQITNYWKEIRNRADQLGIATLLICGISNIYQGLENLNMCHKQAQEALQWGYIKEGMQVLYYKDIKKLEQPKDFYVEVEYDLIPTIKKGDKKQLEEQLRELEKKLQIVGADSYLYLQFFGSNLYSNIQRELAKNEILFEQVFENPVEEFRKLIEYKTIHQAVKGLREKLFAICDYVIQQNEKAYSPPILKALQYIEGHFMDSQLAMDKIINVVHISPGHFSTLFKQEVGITFTDYLNQCRMEEAKKLISLSDIKIYQVAMECGYDNIPYFSTAFKKYTGYSPSEYKSKIKEGQKVEIN